MTNSRVVGNLVRYSGIGISLRDTHTTTVAFNLGVCNSSYMYSNGAANTSTFGNYWSC